MQRTIIDLHRQRDAHQRAVERIESEFDSNSAQEERLICQCLEALKPRYSTLLQRLDLNGEALEPVVYSLGITMNNLKVRLHRARKQLKKRLIQTCHMCAQHGCLDCTCDTALKRK